MNRRLAAFCACLLIAARIGETVAAPSPDVTCAGGQGARQMSLQALPAPVPLELLRHFAPDDPPATLATIADTLIAPRDAAWQVTDVVSQGSPLPGRRFIMGFVAANRVSVWYESGGIAHMFHVVVFERGGDPPWRVSRHLADGSVTALCARLETATVSVYDRFW